MGRKAKNLSGSKFGKLTVIKKAGVEQSHITWLCECECGNQHIVRGSYLLNGRVGSCGNCRECSGTSSLYSGSESLTRLERGRDPYKDLANAIVAVAADDYRTALIDNDEKSKRALENFFGSQWYKTLTRFPANLLLEFLRREYCDSLQWVNLNSKELLV